MDKNGSFYNKRKKNFAKEKLLFCILISRQRRWNLPLERLQICLQLNFSKRKKGKLLRVPKRVIDESSVSNLIKAPQSENYDSCGRFGSPEAKSYK